MNKIIYLLAIILFSTFAHAVEIGVPIQLKLKSPTGDYPTESGLTFTVQILSATGGCVLREETFAGQTLTSGTISLSIGTGTPGAKDASPAIALIDVYSNAAAKNGLTCVDANNNITGTDQSYNPAATDIRIVRVMTTLSGAVNILADFIQRATPYAIQAESVGGKVAADILVQNGSTSLNQTNLETLLANGTRFTKLQNLAVSGNADSATTAVTATNATNFTGSLAGDVTGSMSGTVVSKLNGIALSATAPTTGQVLAYNGSQYVPTTFVASAPVASVNGLTGSVVLTAANIFGAVTSGTAISGDVTGNLAATVVSSVGGKSAAAVATAVTDVNSATALSTANTIAKRDGSGNLVAAAILATNTSTQSVNIYEGTNTNYVQIIAPSSFANYSLTLPTTNGNSGEVLLTDGSGLLSWGSATPTSASIAAALGYTPANSSLVALKASNLSDLASSATARTNLGLTAAATMNVGTTAGTLAAGDDARITGALSQTSFNTYVAGGSCSAGQTMYWNSVSSLFACQNILLSGDVSGIASSVTVTKIQGVGASFSAIANNHILQYNGINFVNRAVPTCAAGEYLTFNGTAYSCAVDAGVGGVVTSISVTAPISSTGGSTPTLSILQANGSGNGYLSSTDWTTFNNKVSATSAAVIAALGYTPANSSDSATYALKANNLSDLASATVARTNLGLTAAAIMNVGTTAGTLAAGDDARIVNALQPSTAFGGDVSGTYNAIALNNSGVTSGTYAKVTVNAKGIITNGTSLDSADVIAALGFTPANNAASGTFALKANNLSDLASATVARTNLGLTAAATMNVGTTAGTLAAGDDARITGALSQTSFNTYVAGGSCSAGQTMYWNSVSSLFACQNILLSGDVSGIASSVTVTKIQGVGASFSAIANNHILQYNGINFVNRAVPTCAAGEYLTFNGTAYSCAVDAGGGGTVTSISVTSPISSTGGSTPTLSILQASGSSNGYLSSTDWTTFNNKVSATSAAVIAALGYTPANSSDSATYALKANNLSDLASATVARTNLGLTAAAIMNVGTTAGTLAAGDDARIVNALQPSTAFGGDVSGTYNAIALNNSGVTSGTYTKLTVNAKGIITSGSSLTSTDVTTALGFTPADNSASGTYALKANNLSDLASATVARTNLGLTAAAIMNVGTTAGTLAAGDDARIVNALQPSTAFGGDVSGTYNAIALNNSGVTSGTYTKLTVNAKGIITSGSSLTSTDVTAALGFTPADNSASGTFALKANNLSDLASATVARTNLGLGSLAILNFVDLSGSQASGTLAAARLPAFTGDATSIVGTSALTLASVGSGVTSGTQYTKVTVDGKGRVTSGSSLTSTDVTTALGFTPADNSASGTYLVKASNLSDVTSATVARTNLGLGGAAILNVGTSASTVAAGDDARITGALSQTSFNTYVAGATCTTGQSMYWNSVTSLFACQNILLSGDVTGIASSVTVTKIQGVGASFSAIASNHILQYNGSNIINSAIPTCGAGQYMTFNGTAWSCVTDVGTAGIVSSVAVTSPLQTTGGNAPTLSMTQATGSVSGYLSGTDWTTFNNKITSSAASVEQVLGFFPANSATTVVRSNNLSDLLDVVSARANLGLGGFATVSSLDLGSASATGTLATARLPAFTGDVSSTAASNSLSVIKIQGVAVSATAPTAGQLMVYNGSTWTPTTDPVSTTRKTADQAVTATAVAATELAFSVVSGVTYKFSYMIIFRSAGTAAGAEFGLTAPAGTLSAAVIIPIAVDGTASAFHGAITASGDTVTGTSTAAIATDYVARVEGVFVATATGSLQLLAGSENTTVITVRAGSVGEIRVIP